MPSKEDDVWEKAAIDDATYVALFDYLMGRQGDAPFYLHKLLFMLRFSEFPVQIDAILLRSFTFLAGGQWPIEDVSDQRKTLIDLVFKQSGLVRLVAMAAYFEAVDSCAFFFHSIYRMPLKSLSLYSRAQADLTKRSVCRSGAVSCEFYQTQSTRLAKGCSPFTTSSKTRRSPRLNFHC